jgi:transcriptional regulator with XRE-family HTH domain
VVDDLVSSWIGFDCGADICTCQQEGADSCVIFLRLKEERERLGLTQPAFAEVASAAKRTVIDWEKGVSSPTAVQLAAMASAGADVLYVVTGERSQAAAEVDLLPPDERVLVDAYRRCNAEARRNLIQTAALLSAGMPPGAAPAPGKMVNKAAGSVQVGHQSGGQVTVKNKGSKR